jgi:hypothetical protein
MSLGDQTRPLDLAARDGRPNQRSTAEIFDERSPLHFARLQQEEIARAQLLYS